MGNRTKLLAEAALHYAELGYCVFPCKPGTKHPATRNGHLDASSDLAKVRAWWRKRPNANIGISMRASGLVAIDPDLYKPDCGWADFVAGKDLPATWQQNTASGGLHYIFRAPANASFPGKLTRHVEVKWDGYIIASPSTFNGGQYRGNGLPPAPAPDWLLGSAGFTEAGSSPSQILEWVTDPVTGLVTDGRENYLTSLVYGAYQDDPGAEPEDLAVVAWGRFQQGADLSRPSQRATEREALRKAYHVHERKPPPKGRLIKDVEPEAALNELQAADAIQQLDDKLEDFFGEMGWSVSDDEALTYDLSQLQPITDYVAPRRAVAGAAGLGKSRRVLARIAARFAAIRAGSADYQQGTVHYLTPTIQLCHELAAEYTRLGGRCAVIRGRTHGHDNPDLKTPCDRPNDVQAVTVAGITNVASTLCQTWVESPGHGRRLVTCPFRDTCGYYAQFEDKDVEVYFMTHEHLYTPLSHELVGRPNLIVIDESPVQKLVSARRAFAPLDIESDALGGLILAELRGGRDPRMAVVAAGWTGASIREHATALESEVPEILPDMKPEDLRRRLKNYRPSVLPRMLRKLSDELTVEHDGIRCLSYSDSVIVKSDDGSTSKAERIWLHYRKHVRALRKDLPVLVLDATADAKLLEPSFPGMTQVTIPAARNARVGQTYGFTASMTKMNGEASKHREEIAKFLRGVAARYTSGLLVTYKEAEQHIELPSDAWSSEHFGNLRGIDKHKDKSAVVVVGRLQPDAVHMEKMALGLFYDSAVPITLAGRYEKRPAGFVLRSGERWGVETDRHPCPIVDRVRRQHSEAEIVQAVDRLRLVHRATPADVYLINEVPTPIVIDRLVAYRQTVGRAGDKGAGGGPGAKLLQAYRELGNVLPASPEWLAEHLPHIWRSANAAKMTLRDFKARAGGDYGELFGGAKGFQLIYGKRLAARFRIWAPDPQTAEAFHDKHFG